MYLLPETCETCGAEVVTRTVSKQFSQTEETQYKCGARYHQYKSHQRKDVRQRCPRDPAEQAKRAREAAIDKAVAAALRRVKATRQECEDLPKRMERDKGWHLRADEGIWALLPPKEIED